MLDCILREEEWGGGMGKYGCDDVPGVEGDDGDEDPEDIG